MAGETWRNEVDQYLGEIDKALINFNFSISSKQMNVTEKTKKALRCWQAEWLRWKDTQDDSGSCSLQAVHTKLTPIYVALFSSNVTVSGLLHRRIYYRSNPSASLEFYEMQTTEQIKLITADGDIWKFEQVWGMPMPLFHGGNNSNSSYPMNNEETKVSLDDNVPITNVESAVHPVVLSYGYNREAAVAYANRYWETPNPAYPYFQDDCTNFISQCLHAGGIPMIFTNNRAKGWWYRHRNEGWSFSWAIANSLESLLAKGGAPFYAQQRETPQELEIGDIICYDFTGDGRWDHNTIVVAKDEQGFPLVNAHTFNAQYRFWEYLDSTAYTPSIKYRYFHVMAVGN
ncbi:hydrolase [Brevibacillus laterosporus]|uniref:Hydrolase n=1 Tax=Brevibacillus laterosporus TaxID=1465 RepID=A0A518V6K7_BRELA|nr:amidase domain-containing protein [Brevibacillus laterosporus]QDX92661.1 hydrolase [Brevibacillus laterosporus]TPG70974.1 hydrolase [Brevibacillus laterosporus]